MTIDEFIKKSIEVHGHKYDYSLSKFKNKYTDIEIICPKHGSFKQPPFRHFKSGCRLCGIHSRINKCILSNDEFIKRAIQIHGSIYNYDRVGYKNSTTKVHIHCNRCNNEFYQTPASHLQKRGCPNCKLSHGENKINNFLITKNIKFQKQKTFKSLVSEKGTPLRFDFFVEEFKLCIEYDGQQHADIKSKFWTPVIKENDNKKNEFCVLNNIHLLRISYLDFNNIEEILLSTLSRY